MNSKKNTDIGVLINTTLFAKIFQTITDFREVSTYNDYNVN